MEVAHNGQAFRVLRRLFVYLRPHRFWLTVKLLATTAGAANDIFLVYLIQLLVNASLSGSREGLIRFAYLIVVFVAVGILVSFLETYSAGRFSACAARDMRDDFSSLVGKLPVSYLEARHSGELVSRITQGINAIERFFREDLTGILFHIIRFAACVAVLLYMNWQLLAASMVLLPLMAVLTHAVGRPMSDASSRLQRSLAVTHSAVQDTIGGIAVVKSFNLADVLLQRFKKANEQLLADSLAIEKRKSLMDSVGVLVRTAPFLLFFLYGGYMVVKGHLTAGGFVAFAQLVNYLVQGLGILPGQIGHFKLAAGVAKHLFELKGERTERSGGISPARISPDAPAIAFSHVTFSYDGAKKVLDDISFVLPQGKTVALVGPSGSGKTTVFKLITGHYEYSAGCIRLFGIPLADWQLSSARSMMSLVSQDAFLFTGTIAENIACGRSDAGMEDVRRAAKMAHIHDFIESLPDQYDTQVGERGVNLSGGQRQRISIARAILKDAPILLLDEATSALDPESEMGVQEAIRRLTRHRTVLVIAHRLSTIIDADQVIVLNEGCMVESGTHAELIARNGAYKRLYDKQFVHRADFSQLEDGEGA
jgi:ABC-type multidrug transport system fused ATPase/permease subunit